MSGTDTQENDTHWARAREILQDWRARGQREPWQEAEREAYLVELAEIFRNATHASTRAQSEAAKAMAIIQGEVDDDTDEEGDAV